MKLHTNLTGPTVFAALAKAQRDGNVSADVHFVTFEAGRSRSHPRRFEIQLGTFDKTTGPTKSRHFKNTGQYGADRIWAATYDEWGYFIAQIFDADPDAVFGPYKGQADFNRQTKDAYALPVDATAVS